MRRKIRLIGWLLLLLAETHAGGVVKILAIGNSFSEDAVEQNLYELAAAGGIETVVANMYIPGCPLELHARNMKEDARAYRYRKIRQGQAQQTDSMRISQALADEDWDFVSVQQASQLSGLYDSYQPYLHELVSYIRRVRPRAEVVFHQTWAYAKNSTREGYENYGKDQMKMFRAIVGASRQAAEAEGIRIVVPSGTAIQNARTSFYGDTMNRDGFHLDLLHGRYTAACTWYAALFGRKVLGNGYAPQGMTPRQVRTSQLAADAAVTHPDRVTPLDEAADGAAATERVRAYIRDSWDKTVRYRPADSADHIGLPHPYTVPCISGRFQEMYYWDTYFTNVGLLIDGRTQLAKGNTENLAFLAGRFGKVPNGSRYMYQYNSQPPYLCMMVEEIYEKTGDVGWLRRMYPVLAEEYAFWMERRRAPCGLNRYANDYPPEGDRGMAEYAKTRTGSDLDLASMPQAEVSRYAANARAECESGWDFTPRFENRCQDFCPVDLNANLYGYEQRMARFSEILGLKRQAKAWTKAARLRKRLVRRYLRDGSDGFYYDYDYANGRFSRVKSAAVFSLLYAKVLSRAEARRLVPQALAALECLHGLAATARADYRYTYQWAYPNGWAPLHYLAIKGLDNYGMKADARRVAGKYVDAIADIFGQTGNLWEKYNVEDGSTNVGSEGGYALPPMMGWTAGIFVYADEYAR